MMKKAGMAFIALAAWALAAEAKDLPQLAISLPQAEAQAQTSSARLASKRSELKSAEAATAGAYALFWPKLSVEGSYTYLHVVPEMTMSLAPDRTLDISLGNHHNYSVGLQAAWNAWDSLQVYNLWKAAQALEQAKKQELRMLRREVTLKTRLAYFQTQLALEKLRLTASSANLSQEQYQDIRAKARAGTASRKDELSSHLEVLARLQQLQAAQTDLTMALRDLLSLTGDETGQEVSQPWYRADPAEAGRAKNATVAVELDALDASLERLKAGGRMPVDPEHPQAQVFLQLTQAAQASAESLASGHWPKLQIMAKASLDYPNGPVAEQIQQNTLAVKASWSIWEAGRVVSQTQEKEAQARAQEQLAANARKELTLAWQKAGDKLRELESEQPLIGQMVRETGELARVAYTAYAAGRAEYIEVQAANLKVLEAGTQAALNKVQQLMQLAMLESLSSDKE